MSTTCLRHAGRGTGWPAQLGRRNAPAYSVILFTTASGAGLGLLAWLALFGLLGLVPAERWLGFAGFALAFVLVTAGLLASTAHLGRPERAWRAFSQWRTSWLSREGVMAVATYRAGGPCWARAGCSWRAQTASSRVTAVLTAACAVLTLLTTGMIYASLRTIRQWHQPLTAPIYIALGLASGAVLLQSAARALRRGALVDRLAGYRRPRHLRRAQVGLLAAHRRRAAHLHHRGGDRPRRTSARCARWSRRTRNPTTSCARWATGSPASTPRSCASWCWSSPSVCPSSACCCRACAALAVLGALLAVLSMGLGLVVERWLFFAEAEHVSMLYYGEEAA